MRLVDWLVALGYLVWISYDGQSVFTVLNEGVGTFLVYLSLTRAAVMLSIVLGWNLTLTILLIGLPTVLYTMVGGVQAVTWTDVKQMAVIVAGLIAAVAVLIVGLPQDVSVVQALHVTGAAGRTNAVDFWFDLRPDHTLLSGMPGGPFLLLS